MRRYGRTSNLLDRSSPGRRRSSSVAKRRPDVAEMRDAGFEVFDNVSDAELIDLYAAADIYANFSRWEGYNLGIGQALALGLPTIASDIPAHRAFPIFTSNEVLTIVEKLAEFVQETINSRFSGERRPILSRWSDSLVKLEREIARLSGRADTANEQGTRHSEAREMSPNPLSNCASDEAQDFVRKRSIEAFCAGIGRKRPRNVDRRSDQRRLSERNR